MSHRLSLRFGEVRFVLPGRRFPQSVRLLAAGLAIWGVGCSATTEPVARAEPLPPRPVAAADIVSGKSVLPNMDTYINSDVANRNYGGHDTLLIQKNPGKSVNRILVSFPQGGITDSLGADVLVSATLELTIKNAGNDWGTSGQAVVLHRMTRDWLEGGATWSCANDLNIGNLKADCPGNTWSMPGTTPPFVTTPVAQSVITNGQSGVVRFDVTSDVRAFLTNQAANQGWMLKLAAETQTGTVVFHARESASKPRLVLSVTHEQSVPAQAPDSVPAWVRADSNFAAPSAYIPVRFRRNILVVHFRRTATQAERQAALDLVSGTVVGGHSGRTGNGFYIVRVADPGDGSRLVEASEQLHALPQVTSAGPDIEFGPNYRKPGDGPGWQAWKVSPGGADGDNWAFEAIAAPLAWGCATGSTSPQVALVDKGFRNNPEIMRNARLGPNSNFGEGDDHGTRLASLIAARGNDGTLMTGMMWQANLGLYEIHGGSADNAIEAAVAAGLDGARVINLSQGINWNITPDPANAAHVKTVDDVHQKFADGLTDLAANSLEPLLVVSAGNNGLDARWNGTPLAKNDGFGHQIIVVGASNRQGGIWAGSNTGALVDVVAPGVEVYSLDGTGSVTAGSPGTSESAALVTGLAGLLLSFDSRMKSSDLKRAITVGATAGGRTANGIPIVNAYESLKEAARAEKAPLCGNRTYLDGPNFYTQRTSGPELLGTLDADTYFNFFSYGAFTGSIAVQHGGKSVLVCVGTSYCGEYLTYQNEAWTTTETPPGEERVSDSGPRNSIHGLSHDGDSMATVTQIGTGSYAGVYKIRLVSVSTGQGRDVGTLTSERTYNFGMDVSVAPGGDFLLLMGQWAVPIPAPDHWAGRADLYVMSTATGESSRLRTWTDTALLGAQIAEDGREAVLVVNGANTCEYEYLSLPGGGTSQTVPSSISYCDRHESRATFLRGRLSASLR